ncbi:S8 family serine peptidase [Streptomyces sp. NPDC059118]|uniref:S8 family serine peptidase n=1 Tax=unclassified Streptomyces TaxID=2593676 RepID=UPI0036900368
MSGDAPAPAAYPAAQRDVLAVAALGPGGVADQKLAPRTAPDLAAPGNAVMSVGPGGTGSFTGDGADLATAFVAGAAALAAASHPDLTPPQPADRLTATAYRIPADRALVGAGTVDPAAAVTAPGPGPSAHAASRAPAGLRMPPPRPTPAAPRRSPSPPPPPGQPSSSPASSRSPSPGPAAGAGAQGVRRHRQYAVAYASARIATWLKTTRTTATCWTTGNRRQGSASAPSVNCSIR